MFATEPGQIVILNGIPRSGKSSIVAVIQETFDGPWMNLGMERRRNTWGGGWADASMLPAVRLWQRAVHTPGIYDLEVDTSLLSPEECADVIRRRLDDGPPPSAFQRLAALSTEQG